MTMSPAARHALLKSRLLLVVSAGLLANLAVQPLRALQHAGQTDYLAFATGAHLSAQGTRSLYGASEQLGVQASILGVTPRTGAEANPFTNLPLVAWLMRPFTWLSLDAGLAVFTTLSMLALAAAAWTLWGLLGGAGLAAGRRAALTVAMTACLPGAEAIALGQWDTLLLLAAATAVVLLQRGRTVEAGMVLSLLLIKPQLVWLVVPALLIASAWRVLAGFAVGALAWAMTGLALVGFGGMRAEVSLVLSRHVGETHLTTGLPGLVAAATASGAAGFAAAASLALAAAATLVRVRGPLRAQPAAALGLGVALSVVCAPHVYADDLLLLAIPLLVIAWWRPVPALALALGLSAAYLADSLVTGARPVEALMATAVAGVLVAILWRGEAAPTVATRQVPATSQA